MAYWFTGNPDTFRAAAIKSERQLKALGQITGAAGTFLGQMRQSREDETKSRLAEERLQATLGEQAETAKAQTSPTPASTAPASGPPQPTPSDPSALQPVEDQPAQAVQNPLQRLASAAAENGLRGLRVLGGMTGLSDPYTPETMHSAEHVAQLQGKLGHEALMQRRLQAAQGHERFYKKPGEFMSRIMQGNYNFSDLEPAPEKSSSLSNLARIQEGWMLGIEPEHTMWERMLQRKTSDKALGQPSATPTKWLPSEQATLQEYRLELKAKYPGKTDREIDALIPPRESADFQARAKKHIHLDERMNRMIEQGLGPLDEGTGEENGLSEEDGQSEEPSPDNPYGIDPFTP